MHNTFTEKLFITKWKMCQRLSIVTCAENEVRMLNVMISNSIHYLNPMWKFIWDMSCKQGYEIFLHICKQLESCKLFDLCMFCCWPMSNPQILRFQVLPVSIMLLWKLSSSLEEWFVIIIASVYSGAKILKIWNYHIGYYTTYFSVLPRLSLPFVKTC